MKTFLLALAFTASAFTASTACFIACNECKTDARVLRGARDVQRHIYIQSGQLCPMVDGGSVDHAGAGAGVVVGSTHPAVARELAREGATEDTHTVMRIDTNATTVVHLAGTTPTATMYACPS